jgi:glycosyltransferase involved in cell wall biosynthesis
VKIAVVGTDLAPLRPTSGALERVVLAWADGLREALPGAEVALVDADDPGRSWAEQVRSLGPDLVVLNNRPLWSEHVNAPVAHVLHNYPDAWGIAGVADAHVRRALEQGTAAAVSPALARHIGAAYHLTESVSEVRVEVEACFFGESWDGRGGPVLFPNRLLEKKGVRHFLALSELLSERGLACVLFRHLAPWTEPTTEQGTLLEAVAACEGVELCPPPGSRREMAAWYRRAAVVLCPSVHPEGLGLVALEAQAIGTPVVTSGSGGLADATLPPNEIVTSGEVADWLAAIARATSRPADAGHCAREAIARSHDSAPATASFVELVLRATSRS